jgi:hypothetical protein
MQLSKIKIYKEILKENYFVMLNFFSLQLYIINIDMINFKPHNYKIVKLIVQQ